MAFRDLFGSFIGTDSAPIDDLPEDGYFSSIVPLSQFDEDYDDCFGTRDDDDEEDY